MYRSKKYLFFLLVLLFTLSTCKKYPENTLWFKRVKKLEFFDKVKLTVFRVNGIDSLNELNSYFGSNVINKNISNAYFEPENFSDNEKLSGGIFQFAYPQGVTKILIPYQYVKNKKFINISFGRFGSWDTAAFKRNLFIDNITPWEIIKLVPNGTRKIKKTVNNNVYELQFDKI